MKTKINDLKKFLGKKKFEEFLWMIFDHSNDTTTNSSNINYSGIKTTEPYYIVLGEDSYDYFDDEYLMREFGFSLNQLTNEEGNRVQDIVDKFLKNLFDEGMYDVTDIEMRYFEEKQKE
jgi:ABC-type Zn2+ transport system substrate-binding protein/surface adhesin